MKKFNIFVVKVACSVLTKAALFLYQKLFYDFSEKIQQKWS